VSSWRGLKKRAHDFETLGVTVIGLSSDNQEQLQKLRDAQEFPFTFLSDPMLLAAPSLKIPISSKKSYLGALAVHPIILELPKKAFHQPSLLIWQGSELGYEWRQTERLRNLFGAKGRPSPAEILDLTQRVMTGERPTLR
jgi:hypothetical protein